MKQGDHIRVERSVYDHHGIYVGRGRVIEYTSDLKTWAFSSRRARIREVSLKTFAQRSDVEVIDYDRGFGPKKVISLARSRIGERDYNIFWNNCEHFARWCKTGEAKSEQVRDAAGFVTRAGIGGTFGLPGVALVAAWDALERRSA